jgi:uncharacterized membrane protein YbaN (DUF454 family)
MMTMATTVKVTAITTMRTMIRINLYTHPRKQVMVIMMMMNASEIVSVIVRQPAIEMRNSTTFLVNLTTWTLTQVGT